MKFAKNTNYQELINRRKDEIKAADESLNAANESTSDEQAELGSLNILMHTLRPIIGAGVLLGAVGLLLTLLTMIQHRDKSDEAVAKNSRKELILKRNGEFINTLSERLAPIQTQKTKIDAVVSIKRPTLEAPDSGKVVWRKEYETKDAAVRVYKKCTTPLRVDINTELYFISSVGEVCEQQY